MSVARNLTLDLYHSREAVNLGQRFLRFAVISLMALSIVAPVVRLNADFWLKLDQLLLPVVVVVYLWLMLAGLARPFRLNALFAVAGTFCLCIVVSIVYGTQVIGHPLLARDFFELPKAIIPAVFFTLALEADLSEESLRTLAVVLVPTIAVICAYAFGQWFNMGFTAYLQPFYSGGLHDDGGLAHYRRVYSTLSNPNYLGILMTWMIAAFAMAAIFRVGSRLWNMVMLVACLVTLAMTSSRYGLIDTAFALLLVFFLPAASKHSQRRRRTLLLAALPVVGLAVVAVLASNRATLERVVELRTPLQENSLRARLDGLWKDAGDKFLESPVVGHGPAKIIFGDIATDSEYMDILKEYGLLGLIPYLGYFLAPLGMVWRGLRQVKRSGPWLDRDVPATYWALCLSFIMILTALGMNVGMSTLYNPSLLAFLWMWMGIGASCARRVARYQAQQTI